MKTERLSFGRGDMPYHAMHSADHLNRYALLRSICRGKRILDVACGEGYGSYLLSEWGASSVVGIDISATAIEKAQVLFAAENITYKVGDVCDLCSILDADLSFDIICSFETIEHVDDPVAFLQGISRLRSDTTVVAISAPNDFIMDEANPFHKHRFTHESLKEVAEAALGEATQWYFGTPMQGHLLLTDEMRTPQDADFSYALKGHDIGTLHLLPCQHNLSVTKEDALFWLGVWGTVENNYAVGSALSMRKFLEPWQTISALEKRRDLLERETRRLETTLAQERHAALSARQRLDDLERLAKISPASVQAIATESCYKKQRWELPYKVRQWIRQTMKSFASRRSQG